MKYLDLDIKNLINDYNDNQSTLVLAIKQVELLERQLKNPFIEAKGDIEVQLQNALHRRDEYQQYVDMVVIGFDALKEIERDILQAYYVDKLTTVEIMNKLFLSKRDLERKKASGLEKFKRVVYPQ